uniref:Uncharacterized protein n=1 Tax=Cacopsylla melanoneura TaxID=428564 RepID=A0A8D8Z3S8_9HEMI
MCTKGNQNVPRHQRSRKFDRRRQQSEILCERSGQSEGGLSSEYRHPVRVIPVAGLDLYGTRVRVRGGFELENSRVWEVGRAGLSRHCLSDCTGTAVPALVTYCTP